MRGLRGSVRFASCALLLGSLSSTASAQLLIATEPGVADAVEHAELAYALGDGAAVTWISLRLKRGPVALVAALPEGANADSALDAWFRALETSASPRVLLPRDTTSCDGELAFVETTWPRGGGAAPDELELAAPDDVAAALAAQGVSLRTELPAAPSYFIWSWSEISEPASSRTLRIQGSRSPLALLPSAAFPVLLSAVTRGTMQYRDERDRSALSLTLTAGLEPRSDYHEQARAWLAGHDEPLVETRSRALLFDWSIQGDLVSVAPLTRAYAQRAAAELPDVDADACAHSLAELRDSSSATWDALACGSARDAALALSAASPELATLQRFVVSGAAGVAPELLVAGGTPIPPVLRAKQLDDSACPGAQQPPSVVEPTPVDPAPVRPPRDEPEPIVEDTIVVEQHEHVEFDCWGSPRPEPAPYYEDEDENDRGDTDCSSDTSSSSDTDTSDPTCSGDTSSGSEADSTDTTCSGDTSSSSDSDQSEPDCSSDSTSSTGSDDDASCDGGPGDTDDADDSYDGDTCTASAAPAAATQKSRASLTRGQRLQRPTRLKTSLWSLAFAALVLPIRRRKRERARC
jgi:hypothetical protein